MAKKYSLSLDPDGGGEFANQSFHSSLGNLGDKEIAEIVIENAGDSRYPKGWHAYKPFYRRQGEPWKRTSPGRFEDGSFYFSFEAPTSGSFEVCWYPPFENADYLDFFDSWNSKLIGSEPPIVKIGSRKDAILVVGGQHPGESMGIWLAIHLLDSISSSELLQKYSLIVCPIINVNSYKNRYHRLTSNGLDFNRSWKKGHFTDKHNSLLDVCKGHNIVCALDAHGDEVSRSAGYIASPGKVSLRNFFSFYVLGEKISKALGFSASRKRLLRSLLIDSSVGTMADFFADRSKVAITVELCAKGTEFGEIPRIADSFTNCLEEVFL